MEYDRQTYFEENREDAVPGFTVVETNPERGYRMVEKCDSPLLSCEGPIWYDYWISESDLSDLIESGSANCAGKLTDEQFAQVCDKVEDERVSA